MNINDNHEDAVVVSESVIKRSKCSKLETVIIPIYTYSLFKNIYPDSPYGFLPDVGQQINDNIITYRCSPKSSKNVVHLLKSMNLSDFTSVLNNELQFNSTPITARVKYGTVVDIRVHPCNQTSLIDKRIQGAIEAMYDQYHDHFMDVYRRIYYAHGKEFANYIASRHYVMLRNSLNRLKYNVGDLAYIIELKIAGENHTHLGDKIANRLTN